jgi:hypothetical protein
MVIPRKPSSLGILDDYMWSVSCSIHLDMLVPSHPRIPHRCMETVWAGACVWNNIDYMLPFAGQRWLQVTQPQAHGT